MEVANKPKTLLRTQNAVHLSWENVFPIEDNTARYRLEVQNVFKEWQLLYWGPKRSFLVEGLAPCSYSNFRLKACGDHSEWIHFKSGTDAVPYFVMHLVRAVKFGKTPVIRKIIHLRPVLLETENKEGKTPLVQAVESGNLQMATFLINLGASVNTAALITKCTPLMAALFRNNLQIAQLLVDKGASLLARDCNLLTGLHYAVGSGCYENVKFCVEQGFEVDARDNKGWTPLLRAVIMECSDDIVSVLLSKGADCTIKDNQGFDFSKHLQLCNREYSENLATPVEHN